MIIRCYHEELSSDFAHLGGLRSADGWRSNWRQQGWSAEVMGLADAPVEDAFYQQFMARAATWPVVNPLDFELACWRRWFVAAKVGGFWCDTDVVSLGFLPPKAEPARMTCWPVSDNPVGGVIYGSPEDFRSFLQWAFETGPLYPDKHSDMFAWMRWMALGNMEVIEGMAGYCYPLMHVTHKAGSHRAKILRTLQNNF